MTTAQRVQRLVTAVLVTVTELVLLAVSAVVGFIGSSNAAKISIAGYRPTPSERRLGAVLVVVATLLPAIVPFCVWAKTRSTTALTVSGVLLFGGGFLWTFLVLTNS